MLGAVLLHAAASSVSVLSTKGSEHAEEDHCKNYEFACIDMEKHSPLILVILAGLLLFSFLLEQLFEFIERFASRNHIGQPLVHAVFKELMIVGIVSFSLFVVEYSTSNLIKHEWKIIFEFVHMALFVSAVFFVCIIFATSLASRGKIIKWKKWERITFEFTERKYEEMESHSSFCGLVMEKKSLRFYFHKIRKDFISAHSLNPEFEFHKYLELCLFDTFIVVAELSWKVWALLSTLMGLGLALDISVNEGSVGQASSKRKDTPEANINLAYFLCFIAYCISIVLIVMRMKLNSITKRTAINPPVDLSQPSSSQPLLIESEVTNYGSDHDNGDVSMTGVTLLADANARRNRSSSNQSLARLEADEMDEDDVAEIERQVDEEEEEAHVEVARVLDANPESYDNPYFDMFWFRRPYVIRWLIQFTMLFHAIYISLFVLAYCHLEDMKYGLFVVYLLPTVQYATFFAPKSLSQYVFLTSIGPLAKHHHIQKMVREDVNEAALNNEALLFHHHHKVVDEITPTHHH